MKRISSQDIYGSMVALVTPMHIDGSINYGQWEKIIQWHISSKTRAIIVAGTTGESALLTDAELSQLLTIATQLCQNTETYVIAATGTIKTQQVIENNQLATIAGAQAALVVTPYYIRVNQQHLIQHYTEIADASEIPIILYNIPSRTTIDIETSTSLTLAKHKNIIAIKEGKPDMQRIIQLSQSSYEFAILSADDATFLQALHNGANGVISVAANVRPKTINNICQAHLLGDHNQSKQLNDDLKPLYQYLTIQPNPIPVKRLLYDAGLIDCGIRPPLRWLENIDKGWKNQIKNIKQEYES